MNLEIILAYIGPGAGLGAVGSLLALVGAVLLMIVGFIWYPLKRLLRRVKADDFDWTYPDRRGKADRAKKEDSVTE